VIGGGGGEERVGRKIMLRIVCKQKINIKKRGLVNYIKQVQGSMVKA
jgi:hypothetical protein